MTRRVMPVFSLVLAVLASPARAEPTPLACDPAARLLACGAALLRDGAPAPVDPSDPLVLVDRAEGLDPGWLPFGADERLCRRGKRRRAKTRRGAPTDDLVCVPRVWAAQEAALREPAWDAPAPPSPVRTHDDLAVGFEGRVGFRPLIEAAWREAGHRVYVASGFRSYAEQEALHGRYVARERALGRGVPAALREVATFSAQPGHSEHQLGAAADLVWRDPDGTLTDIDVQQRLAIAATPAWAWLTANAHRFGVALSYPADQVEQTGYAFEPWHWRFVGVAAADAMHACGVAPPVFLRARYGRASPVTEAERRRLREDRVAWSGPPSRCRTTLGPASGVTFPLRVVNAGTLGWVGYRIAPVAADSGAPEAVALPCVPAGSSAEVRVEVPISGSGFERTVWALFDATGAPVLGPELTLDAFALPTLPVEDGRAWDPCAALTPQL